MYLEPIESQVVLEAAIKFKTTLNSGHDNISTKTILSPAAPKGREILQCPPSVRPSDIDVMLFEFFMNFFVKKNLFFRKVFTL